MLEQVIVSRMAYTSASVFLAFTLVLTNCYVMSFILSLCAYNRSRLVVVRASTGFNANQAGCQLRE